MPPDASAHPVLILEDDEELRDVLVVLMELNGYAAVGAADAEQALAVLRNGVAPGLIVFDLMLPGKTGWEFRAEQLNDPALADIPAVAISAAVQGSSVRKALQVEALLAKPLDIDQLMALVELHCPKKTATAPP